MAPDIDKVKLWQPPATTWAIGIPFKQDRNSGESRKPPLLPAPSCPQSLAPHVAIRPSGKINEMTVFRTTVWK